MREWIHSQTRNRDARAMMRLMVEGLYTVDPDQVSLLFFLSYIRSAGTLEELWETEGGAQAFHVPGSMHQLAGRMGAQLLDDLVLEAPATAIAQDASGVTVTSPAGQFRARARDRHGAAAAHGAHLLRARPAAAARRAGAALADGFGHQVLGGLPGALLEKARLERRGHERPAADRRLLRRFAARRERRPARRVSSRRAPRSRFRAGRWRSDAG